MILAQLGYPREMILEELGVSDPQRAMEIYYMEKYIEHENNLIMQREMMEMQANLQNALQMQQMAQQQLAQQQAAELARSGEALLRQGQMFNPAVGGMPPAMLQPEATREQLTGQTRGGVPIAEEVE